ncbi:MAG TPA: hypothetical protein VFY25_10595, partial [Anaerolineales bacterium]|nr:hypothetical protein [Anaerolineales bacterium]
NERSRYRYLETIRQYAMEKLVESGEAASVRTRHMEHFLQSMQRATDAEPRIFGQEDIAWLDQMELEHDNLRSALEWATSNHPRQALQLAYVAGSFWVARDYNHEARKWCQMALEGSKSIPGLDDERAKVYGMLAWSSIAIGDHKTGREAAEAGVALARVVGDMPTLGRLLSVIALACTFLGDFAAGEEAIAEAETLTRQMGYLAELSLMLTTRAQMTYFAYGDVVRAKAYLDEAISISRHARLQWATTMSVFGMARIAGNTGDLVTARASFLQSAGDARKAGNKRLMYSCYSELAHVLRENGEVEEPLAIYRDLLPKWKDLGHRAAVAHELECIAYILARKKKPERAAAILGAADRLRVLIESSPTPMEQAEYDREIATIRRNAGDQRFEQAWAEGQLLSLDDAIALAIREE